MTPADARHDPDPTPDPTLAVEADASPRRARTVRIVVIGVLVVAVVLGVGFGSRFGTDPKAVRSLLIDRPAPSFRLTRLDGGGDVALEDLRGKIVVLNFWAPWCVPCQAEHTELGRSAADLAGQDVVVIGVVNDADVDSARTFVAERGANYPQLVEQASGSTIDYGVVGVPETFFIDEAGVVRGKVAGPVDRQTVQSTVDAMRARGAGSP